MSDTALARGGTYDMVGGWSIQASAGDPTGELSMFIAGYQTPLSGKPTMGTAVYDGTQGVKGEVFAPPASQDLLSPPYRVFDLSGDAKLTVNFASGAVSGTLSNMKDNGGMAWNGVSITGSLSGTNLSGTTATTSTGPSAAALGAATGTIRGALYGPVANELAAVWTLSDGTKTALGTISSGLVSASGLDSNINAALALCCAAALTADAGGPPGPFHGLNSGSLVSVHPSDNTFAPLTTDVVNAPTGPIGVLSSAPSLDFVTMDLSTGKPTLTLSPVAGISISLTDAGAGDPADQFPAERYSGNDLDGRTYNVSLRHLDYLVFGAWDDPNGSYEWIGGYETPAGGVPTSGTAAYAGATYGAVDATVNGATSQGVLKGQANLSVNFGTGQLTGSLTSMTVTPSGGAAQPWNDVSLSATLSGAHFSGTTATPSSPSGAYALAATAKGYLNGGFYGPSAEELGAVWDLSDTKARAVGTIGARKQ